jgi:hypothetical protein
MHVVCGIVSMRAQHERVQHVDRNVSERDVVIC